MRKTYSFSLYENNEKDKALIQLLEILPKHLRGKFIRSMLLKAIEDKVFESVEVLKREAETENRKEDTTQEQKIAENTTKSETKKTYSKNNPFEGLKI
ncbi:hypothetical protein FHQ18_09330 [Deferribacter autotrophicus]|uniref:Uncharacterized protein n=1 Tax=Deferribacter autotrophicus TaxID=500465 RepID=A0A5A8F3H4_9BACT|nr:hypothetical protein [Deferribacter autotrophicus]KAA0257534.1 hypothetical protein FHQ18_09330 [Deferribacter autotrophicus]